MAGPLVPPPDCGAVGLAPLTGGVSEASVWRAVLSGCEVVVKRTEARERIALGLLAGLGVPVLPRVLTSGQDEQGEWLVMPFHSGPACAWISGLRDFGRRAWEEARELVGERVWQQGATLTEQMLDDARFRSLGSAWR